MGKRNQPPEFIEVQGNNGGSFVAIARTERDGVVHLNVGHDCVIRIDQEITAAALAAILAHAKDIGFQKMLEGEYAYQNGEVPEWVRVEP